MNHYAAILIFISFLLLICFFSVKSIFFPPPFSPLPAADLQTFWRQEYYPVTEEGRGWELNEKTDYAGWGVAQCAAMYLQMPA